MADLNLPTATRLVIAGVQSDPRDFIFVYNPSRVSRKRAANYADAIAAGQDLGPSYAGPSPIQWVHNRPEDIHVEFTLHASGEGDVEGDLLALDVLMERDTRTGEPPDLLFVMGARSDRVRLVDKSIDEKFYTADLRCQQAIVTLQLRTLKPRQ